MAAPVKASKSYRDGCVKLRVSAKSGGYGGPSIASSIDLDLKAEDAKALCQELLAEVERAEAKVAAKAAAEDRRKKWRDREIAAGRMKIISFR
jgi:hypothetical protein